jgi:hypothetical protein
MDRVLGYEPRGRAFESLRAHQISVTNQHLIVNAIGCFSLGCPIESILYYSDYLVCGYMFWLSVDRSFV